MRNKKYPAVTPIAREKAAYMRLIIAGGGNIVEIVDTKKAIGRNLSKLRGASGLTQERLCELADIDRSYLQRLEKGQFNPTLEVLTRLKKAFKCSWDDLLHRID